MSMTKECCTRPVIESDYQPKGTDVVLGNNLRVYQAGDLSSKRVLIAAHDIFGFHPNTKQFCDQLAKDGFLVVLPDFFRGSPWTPDNFPPKDMQELFDWIAKAGAWEIVQPDIAHVLEHYKKGGATGFGIFGFCWGGKVSIRAVSEDFSNDILGAALIHPSFVDEKDANATKRPILFIPSKNEADMVPLYKIVQERLGEDAAEHFRFDDMTHGYAGGRGDFKDELNKQRVEETIALVSKFFNKHIKTK